MCELTGHHRFKLLGRGKNRFADENEKINRNFGPQKATMCASFLLGSTMLGIFYPFLINRLLITCLKYFRVQVNDFFNQLNKTQRYQFKVNTNKKLNSSHLMTMG